MTELKPCPFCGGEAEVIAGNNWIQVGCPECDITTATIRAIDDPSRIVKAWNTRHEATFNVSRSKNDTNSAIRYLTANEAASIASLHPVNFREMCREGKIPGAVRIGSRWRIPSDFMERLA